MKTFNEKRISNLYKEGRNPILIMKEFGCSRTTFYRILKRNKIKIFSKGYFHKGATAWNKGLKGKKYLKYYFEGKHPCLGKKLTKKEKRKISKTTTKAMQRIEVKEKMSKWKGNVKKPNLSKIRKKMFKENKLKRMFGKENPAWKGGIYKLNRQIRLSREYKSWRKEVLKRDKNICQRCGKKGIDAHHKISFKDILEKFKIKSYKESLLCKESWNISNGETLCKKCHGTGN